MEEEGYLEDKLEQLYAKLQRFDNHEKQLRIGNNKFDYSDKDPIFFLNGPNRKQTRTGACTSCRETVFETNSSIDFCQFCGHNTCENCLYKERMFPRGRINADGQKPRGEICKLCDRKFMLRQITIDTAVSVNKNRQNVTNLQGNSDELSKELILLVNKQNIEILKFRDLEAELEDLKIEEKLLSDKLKTQEQHKIELASKITEIHEMEHEAGGEHSSDLDDPKDKFVQGK